MTLIHRLKSTFAAAGLSAALCASATADVIPVKPEDASKHFAAVSKHLELGGLFFTYVDVDGDLANLGAMGDTFVEMARKQSKGINPGLSVAKIVDALGLNSVKAVGLSSRAEGDGLYRNRGLLYMPDGPKGLFKLFGGKAAPYKVTSFAPSDSGMALQMDLSLATVLETAENVIKATGDEQALNQYKLALTFPVPGLSMSVGEMIGKLNTRVMVSMRFEDGARLSLPTTHVEVPRTQVMIAFDDIDFLMQPLLAALADNDDFTVEKGEGFTILRPNQTLPGDLEYFKPALYHDQKNKRLILTSHVEIARKAGTGETLGSSAAFKKAMEGLPAEGNGLTYVTPAFIKTFLDFYKDAIKQAAGAGGTAPPGFDDGIEAALKLFPHPKVPVAGTYANVPEGMLFMSNSSETHKQTLAQVAIVPAAFIAASLTAYQQTSLKIREASEERARPLPRRLPEPNKEGGEAAIKEIRNNLQQIAFSAQTYFLENKKETEVSYETLVKKELIFELDSVAGETYKGLTLDRDGGELKVKTKSGESISLKYKASK